MSRVKSNPLATRFVQPGRIAWHASQPDRSLDALVDRFNNQLNSRAAIVGPHGSGKSTLLTHLVPLLGCLVLQRATYSAAESQDGSTAPVRPVHPNRSVRSIVSLQLRGRAASAALLNETRPQWSSMNSVLVIDGYEQLTLFSRAMILWATKRKSAGLLVTSHRRTRLPTLIETKVDAQLAIHLLDRLLPDDVPHRSDLLNSQRLMALLDQHDGNLREVFMQLYDEID